ncbi:MAG: rane protein [Bacillales bacterium]|jgi:uncharacterized membrane protein (DUF441 family)|nr:rane protein [Bacillales bacterium]
MNQQYIFLIILLLVGAFAKNQSLIVAIIFLLLIKIFNLDEKILPTIHSKGINWGVTIITVAVLVPIATGEIGFTQLKQAVVSLNSWIALFAGIAVAMLGKNGIELLTKDPHLTAALVIGTVLAVALFQGVAVGPIIAAGIALVIMKITDFILKFF